MRAGSYKSEPMDNYLFLYKDDYEEGWNVIEGEAQTKMQFLEDIDEQFLKYDTWVVYLTINPSHKDDLVHNGQIDELTDDN